MKKVFLLLAAASFAVMACNKPVYDDNTEKKPEEPEENTDPATPENPETPEEKTDIPAAPKAGELVIEEIYYSGTLIPGAENASDDQYIKLTNVSDHTVYADRVLFVMNYIMGDKTDVGAYYEYPELEDGLARPSLH